MKRTRTNAFLCMAASILLSSLAQLSMKVSMLILSEDMASEQVVQGLTLITALFEPQVIIWLSVGIMSYALSLVFWLFAIARLELSLAYPMLSLSYVIVYLVAISWSYLHEELSWSRSLGILIVVAGVLLIARSDRQNKQINQVDIQE